MLLEFIIVRKVKDHLERNKLIKKSQNGFTKGKSSLTNLLSLYSRVSEEADRDKNYDIIYLDFSKHFDKIPSPRFLLNLRRSQ